MAKEDFCFTYYDGDAARDKAHMNRLERGAYDDLISAQRKRGHLSVADIQKVLGTDFDRCWPAMQWVLEKEGDLYYIEWVDKSVRDMRENSKKQKERVSEYWKKKKELAEKNTKPENGNTKTIPRNNHGMSLEEPLEDGDENGDGDGKESKRGKGNGSPKFKLIFPWESKEFLKAWDVWVNYRIEAKKPYHTGSNQQMALQQLAELANGNEKTAIGIIKNVMAKNGLNFFIDGKQQSTNSQNPHAPSVAATALDHFNKLRGNHNGGGDQGGFDEHRDAG